MQYRSNHRRGLSTLHIVLIVAGIVVVLGCLGLALLAGIMLPAFGKARVMAMAAMSEANLRAIESARNARISEHRIANPDSNDLPIDMLELDRLVRDGLLTIETVQSPYDRPPDGQPDYWVMLVRPVEQAVEDAFMFIVSYDQAMYAESLHLPACFLDGQCRTMRIDEFEALLAHPANAGRDFDLPAQQR